MTAGPTGRWTHGEHVPTLAEKHGSFRRILQSTAVVGGASAVNVLIGLIRTKALAVLLGPSGVGLLGVFTTIADLARTAAEVGVNSSGVRQVADAAASGNSSNLARTVTAIRRTSLLLGVLGGTMLAAVAAIVSEITFSSREHQISIAVLGLAVFLRLVADGQAALLQGLRRINELAKINIWGAVLGTAVTLLTIVAMGPAGIALSLVGVAGSTLLASWWYARTIALPPAAFRASELFGEARQLLRLGMAFMVSAAFTMGAAYIVRIILIHHEGLESAGLYQAAWALGGTYLAFVLQAMGTDFYPRLVAAKDNAAECNRIVNDQTLVSILLAACGVIATITLAPWVLQLLYSKSFVDAADNLRWVCLGMAMRVITWPLGYILVAKGRGTLFVLVDAAWSVLNVMLTLICVRQLGAQGAGIAFFLAYVGHLCILYPLCRRLTGFQWTRESSFAVVIFASLTAAAMWSTYSMDPRNATAMGMSLFIVASLWAITRLRALAGANAVPRRLGRIFGRKPAASHTSE